MAITTTPSVLIDWYADDDFADAIDDVTAAVIGDPGLTVEYGRDTARSTGPPMIGSADCSLVNEDRAFSPENPSSARYQFIRPGRPFKASVAHGERRLYRSHTLYRGHVPYRGLGSFPLISGHTSAFRQQSEIGRRRVDVEALGTIARLKRTVISLQLTQPMTTDNAVTSTLDAAGWPADKRAISTGDSQMHWWWVDERPAWDVLVELTATEGAGSCLWEDGDGVLHWENRNFRTTNARSLTPQLTLHDGTVAGGLFYTRLQYDPRWEDIINRAAVTIKQRAATTSQVVWKLGADLALAGGATETIIARPQTPFVLAVTPVITTDYTVTNGTVTVSLDWANGAVARIIVTATSSVPTVHDLQLRATPIEEVGETEIASTIAVASDDEAKTFKIAAWPELDTNHAKAICDSYVARYRDSRPIIDVTFQNADIDHMEAILDLRISDRIALTNEHLGLSEAEVYVEKIRHALTTGGRHEVTLSCEPVSSIGSLGGVWDSAVWDSDVWGV